MCGGDGAVNELDDGGGHVPVAVTDRNGVDESVHHGSVVAIDGDGRIAFSAGNPSLPVYARSALKPLQAAAMGDAGLAADDEQLALMCASHDGTERHCAVVRRLLADAGLSEDALGNTPSYPLNVDAFHSMIRAGEGPTAMRMNCSGKHAGMVATCVVNGWDTVSYLASDHPLQRHITDVVAELAGTVANVGVDGCGAPTHSIDLVGLARAFAALARDRADIYRAMTTHPDLVGGETRDVTRLMRSVPGLLAKEGADGVYAAAMHDGRAVALKIADGASRARMPVMLAALAMLGIDTTERHDDLCPPILGHGRPVGSVRSVIGR
jgi:L-asparaginase II